MTCQISQNAKHILIRALQRGHPMSPIFLLNSASLTLCLMPLVITVPGITPLPPISCTTSRIVKTLHEDKVC
jgi:hypothetical protein